MKHPFALAFGLILLAAVAAGVVGPLYAESGESCRSLLVQDQASFCDTHVRRRWIVLLALLAPAVPLVLAGLLRSREPDSNPARGNAQAAAAAAAAGLLTVPVALVLLVPLAVLDLLLYGLTQATTGVPFIFSAAALAVGALLAARLAVRAGADEGMALAGAAAGLPLVLTVQAVAEAFRWRLDDIAPPLLLSGPFASHDRNDAATLVTLVLAAIPMLLALGLAAWSRRRLPAGVGVGLLFLSALAGSVLLAADVEARPGLSIRWLPVLLLPAGLAILAMCVRSRSNQPEPQSVLVKG